MSYISDHRGFGRYGYHPFGMVIVDRSKSYQDYRFGFNGKENDNGVKGTSNSVDFGARVYDSRLGRWLSIDPFTTTYPSLAPHQFAGDNPIAFFDRDGNKMFISYMDNDQWSAFKTMIEERFQGNVTLEYETRERTVNEVVDGKVVTYQEVFYEVKMTLNEQNIENKIREGNPDRSDDLIQQKVNEQIQNLKGEWTYQYLNTLINTRENGSVRFSLMDGVALADYENRVINAKSISQAGSERFTPLLHEIAEQTAKGNNVKLLGLSNGYAAHHWKALEIQARDKGGEMAINSRDCYYDEDNCSVTYVLFTKGKQNGKSGYFRTEYSFDMSLTEITSEIQKGEMKFISVGQFQKEVEDAKEQVNELDE